MVGYVLAVRKCDGEELLQRVRYINSPVLKVEQAYKRQAQLWPQHAIGCKQQTVETSPHIFLLPLFRARNRIASKAVLTMISAMHSHYLDAADTTLSQAAKMVPTYYSLAPDY
ncbi:hypothetical protein VOLCADRAFT_95220 [Volvox carteri f. nagariensis]|uniref:Uncharacterized protein n=1 Tax=Volvox carteri f. nagariensis TaxID=3068 RepID=D8U6X6_VOLCA|nr:uncharacterized protein VOLCADRAFT_95220 [Volvox carteri f. nagariensis]EFJ44513.1 hypothetical protein VOLCADRAFT_95220 [Volvox carteri f. nagariensis]|eukprot:XP_002954363.1 hypothetical protein VOLCADRAFT_95220 [Volvox carteri f. nagariensis]